MSTKGRRAHKCPSSECRKWILHTRGHHQIGFSVQCFRKRRGRSGWVTRWWIPPSPCASTGFQAPRKVEDFLGQPKFLSGGSNAKKTPAQDPAAPEKFMGTQRVPFSMNKKGTKKVQNVPSLNGHVGANFGSQGVLMPEFSHTGQPNVQDGGSPGENFAQERVFGTPRSMDFTTGAGQKNPRPNQEGGGVGQAQCGHPCGPPRESMSMR